MTQHRLHWHPDGDRGLGEGHQHAGSPADGEFAEASSTGSADGQVGMLKQAGDVITEASLGQVGVMLLISGSFPPVR